MNNLSNNTIVIINKRWEWAISFALYAVLFLLMWEYHRWRGKPYSLFTANKALAITSSLLISSSIALGPLTRLMGKSNKALRLRRPLGVTATVFMVLHVIASLFLLEKFDLVYYKQYWLSLIFGVIALAGFLLLWVTSYKWALKQLKQQRWKALHKMGYIFLALMILHIVAHGKIPNWINWCKTFDQPVPPGTIIPSLFAAMAILLKLIDRTFAGRRGV